MGDKKVSVVSWGGDALPMDYVEDVVSVEVHLNDGTSITFCSSEFPLSGQKNELYMYLADELEGSQ